jgi:hypothetical protein
MPSAEETSMADIEDMDDDDYQEQIEQMIMENGMLVHSIAALLVRKGVLSQEDIDAEMKKLYEQVEGFEDEE